VQGLEPCSGYSALRKYTHLVVLVDISARDSNGGQTGVLKVAVVKNSCTVTTQGAALSISLECMYCFFRAFCADVCEAATTGVLLLPLFLQLLLCALSAAPSGLQPDRALNW
jgi:hypothetical protein